MPRVTLQTVADRVGVSRMTVSNAFSRPDQLSATLRDRILTAARELGYVGPDPAARALARGTTGAVGIVLTESLRYAFVDQVATSFLGAIAEELAPTGLALTLLSSSDRAQVIPARDVAVDGALIYSCDPTSTAVDWLSRRQLPLVFVDQEPTDGVDCVNVADRLGARAAAQHLIELGHRRIGLLTSGLHDPHGLIDKPHELLDGYPSRQRVLGWLDALDAAGIAPVIVRQREGNPQHGRAGAHLLLDHDPGLTAVLCFSDAIAFGVAQAAHERRLRVPEDLSIVGFDDNQLAGQMRPGLTTVRQDVEEKGRAAAAALTEAIRRTRAGQPVEGRHILIPTELIVRASTAAPPAVP